MKQRKIVYVIEDEEDIAELLRFNLTLKGYELKTFPSGEVGLKAFLENPPDLLLLDLMLPGMSGLDICKEIRAHKNTSSLPIIMLTAKGEEQDIVRGLEIGADDYIPKPFSPKILNARVSALFRRDRQHVPDKVSTIKLRELEIHPGRYEVLVNGAKVDLTHSEFQILHFLVMRPGWVFTRGQIVDAIRGENYAVTDRSIDFQMVGLRKKLGAAGDYIETVRGVGYKFKE
ncbi:MAG: response regulator transcription factor [Bdellovibrionales bacterium]|nr:response regulator transcription factor [Bdellovibrionales bacterium]